MPRHRPICTDNGVDCKQEPTAASSRKGKAKSPKIRDDGTLTIPLPEEKLASPRRKGQECVPDKPAEAAPLLHHFLICLAAARFLWHDSRSANVDVAGDPLLSAEYGKYELPAWLHFTSVAVVSFYAYHFAEWGAHMIGHNRKYGGDVYRIHIAHHRYYHCGNLIQDGPYVFVMTSARLCLVLLLFLCVCSPRPGPLHLRAHSLEHCVTFKTL
jgi:hypothetical protein